MSTTSGDQELVVVTGASTGIGAATARELARRGFHVLAGVRRKIDGDAIEGDHLEALILDVTRPDQVAAVGERIAADERPLRVLVNNAAIQINAPVETLPLDEWRRLFEVNLFGQVAMIQATMPALLKSKGRIINMSSVGGKIAMATYGAYAGAKFALEAMSDSLRREVSPSGVQVVVVEPGAVKTEMAGRGAAAATHLLAGLTPEQKQRYSPLVAAVIAQTDAFMANALSAEQAALVIADAATARRPKTRYTIGRDAALLTRVARLLTDRALDWMFSSALRRYYPKAT
jgi:NAD(P)-dependent dehydrogenase (short-subunit alcohol dehydrogenase family)